jgi:hypothetical protein
MGKHANQATYREWERRQDRAQDDYFEAQPELTEEEKAAAWDDSYWERLDASRQYALPIQRVSLWDEPKGMR